MRPVSLIISLLLIFVSLPGFARDANQFDRKAVRDAVLKLLPEGETIYFMVEIPSEIYDRSISNSIRNTLSTCSSAKKSLVIAGPNNELNYEELQFTLSTVSNRKFSGCRIIFVGSPSNFEELKMLALKLEVEFHAIAYPEK